MPTTQVINIKLKSTEWKRKTGRYVYIGRPSMYGNQFTHLKFLKMADIIIVSTVEEAVRNYREWLYHRQWKLLQQGRRENIWRNMGKLDGKYLGCYCDPEPCHGHVLAKAVEDWKAGKIPS